MTTLAVENPGMKIRSAAAASSKASMASASITPLDLAISRILAMSSPEPSSSTTISIWSPCSRASSEMRPVAGFPAALARRRIFESVIDGIPQHVQQRLKEAVDDRLVGFGAVVRNPELNFFPKLGGSVPHPARKAAERPGQGIMRIRMTVRCMSPVRRSKPA